MYYHNHILRSAQAQEGGEPFTISVKSDNSGTSNDDQYIIPTNDGVYTYDYNVETSDGQSFSNQTGDLTITFPSAGTFEIEISGTFPHFQANLSGDSAKLVDILQFGGISWLDFTSFIQDCSSLTDVTTTDLPDLSLVTSMQSAMRAGNSLTSITNIGNWDMSNITDMSFMFRDQSVGSFTTKDFSDWDVSSVTTMQQMFFNAEFFGTGADMTGWDVTSVLTTSQMFRLDSGFNQSSISNLQFTACLDFTGMFQDTLSFNQPLNWTFKTSGNITLADMFRGASVFNGDVTGWNVEGVKTMSGTFRSSAFNQDISSWTVTAVTTMSNMFTNSSLNQTNYDLILHDVNGWPSLSVKQNVTMTNIVTGFTGTVADSGTTTSATTNKLIDSGQTDFLTTVTVGDGVHNTTTNKWTVVNSVDSNTELTLNSDEMGSGQDYIIYSNSAGRGRARLSDEGGFTWNITDGGAV